MSVLNDLDVDDFSSISCGEQKSNFARLIRTPKFVNLEGARMNTLYRRLACIILAGCFLYSGSQAQWSGNPTINNPIGTADNNQRFPVIISDGQGGAIIAWEDERAGFSVYDIYAQRIDGNGFIQWDVTGIPVCNSVGNQYKPRMVTDGQGGAILAFKDTRFSDPDIFVQRIGPDGKRKWNSEGLNVISAFYRDQQQTNPDITPDGQGGAFIAWTQRTIVGGADNTIWTQHINANGLLQWGDGVVPVPFDPTANGYYQNDPIICSDGTGGLIVAFLYFRAANGNDLYVQRVKGTPLWASDGVPVCAVGGNQGVPVMAADGLGGAIIAWPDDRQITTREVYSNRVDGSGTLLWPGGIVSSAGGKQDNPALLSLGNGSAIIVWEDYRGGSTSDIYAQLYNASGAPQWGANGKLICNAANSQTFPAISSDGAGGAIISWEDRRNGNLNSDIYAQRISASGTVLWAANGVVISNATRPQSLPVLINDAGNSAIIAWEDYRADINNSGVYAFKILGDGTYPKGKPQVQLSMKSIAFGLTPIGRFTDKTVIITNSGGDTLRINAINPSSSVFTVKSQQYVIASGQSVTDTLRFTPSVTGKVDGFFVINSNAPTVNDTIFSSGYGTGSPIIQFSEKSIAFGAVKVKLQKDSVIQISNTGLDTLKISSVSSSNPAFSVTIQSQTVLPGKSFDEVVRFKPGAPGLVKARLLFNSNSLSPQDTMFVEGIGIGEVEIIVSPDVVVFPNTPIGVRRDTLVSIKNNGNDTLRVTGVSSDAKQFAMLPTTFNVSPGQTYQANIRFIPSFVGSISGNVEMYSNSSTTPDVIRVLGTGDPGVLVSPNSIDMGVVYTNSYKDTVVMIENLQGDTLHISDVTSDDPAFSMRPKVLVIPPGETFFDTLRFTPAGIGSVLATLSIISDAPSSPELISVQGEGKFLIGVESVKPVPTQVSFYPNFPNPFSYETVVPFQLDVSGIVTMRILNALGQEHARLIDSKFMQPGQYSVTWQPQHLSSGLYRCAITLDGREYSKTLIHIR